MFRRRRSGRIGTAVGWGSHQGLQFPQQLLAASDLLAEDPHAGALAADLPSAGEQSPIFLRRQGDRLAAA
ncbi:hypothetical protein ACWCPF_38710 [Streptomyces sp. NPDC001858]